MTATKIEWADRVWNPVAGCTIVSPGCTNCYAMRMAHRIGKSLGAKKKYGGLTKVVNGHPVWTGEVRLVESALDLPFRWKKPARIFVNSMSDLFHEDVPDKWLFAIMGPMIAASWHTFLVLTKRPERMRAFIKKRGYPAFPNIWWGVSVEDRERLSRIGILRGTPAAIRFISFEPLLEDMGEIDLRGIHWVIVGGESGPGARPMHPDWARSIRDQCRSAGVAFFMKQMNKKTAIPDDLFIREFPDAPRS